MIDILYLMLGFYSGGLLGYLVGCMIECRRYDGEIQSIKDAERARAIFEYKQMGGEV